MRHTIGMAVVALGACLTLSGCFGSSSPEPTAAHSRHPQSGTGSPSTDTSTTPTSPTTSAGTSAPTSGSTSGAAAVLSFTPKSNGRHSHTCIQVTGTSPVDYIYYPVVVQSSASVTLDSLSVTYADGVQVAGSWVAPAASTLGTGTVEGWPAPPILTQNSSVQWSKRVVAAGATLASGTPYNTFLHLRVYPDQLPYHTDGVVLTYHDAAGSHSDTWVDHVVYQAGKC